MESLAKTTWHVVFDRWQPTQEQTKSLTLALIFLNTNRDLIR